MQLSTDALNRATLARQHLLERTTASPVEVAERLVGLQSQLPGPPYAGLWSRIEDFAFSDLSALIESRELVRMGLMRGTIHLVSARDGAGLWPFTVAVMDSGWESMRRAVLEEAGVDVEAAMAETERRLREAPMTADALGAALADQWPAAKPNLLGSIARFRHPVVQIPPRGLWGKSGPAIYALIDDWTGTERPAYEPREIVRRYLAGYGPASPADMQQWCGVKRLRAVFAELGDELITVLGPDGKTLHDLPDAPRPDADTPAPVRLLPEWDNLLLSHADRTRVIDEDRRKAIMSVNGINDAAVLVDGRVEATWKAIAGKGGGTLTVAPFTALSKSARAEIDQEGEALLEAMGEGYAGGEVVFEGNGAAWQPSWKAAHKRS